MGTTIDLRPDHIALARELVTRGRYSSVDDVVKHAMDLLRDQESEIGSEEVHLLRCLDEDESAAGGRESIPAEEVFGRLREQIARFQTKRERG